jgi:hypothetical protein
VTRYQIVTVDGDVYGPTDLGEPDWPEGAVIHYHDVDLRVVKRVETDDPEMFTILIVEQTDRELDL